ncbi:MAG: FAD:protein FMN transferase [Actinomycetia bacterium]|nr:FAD:protein FMN transferase [Actinomycetes bacterium]
MVRCSWRAMGTTFELVAPADRAEAACRDVAAVVADWERTFSRFDPASELTRVNTAAGSPVRTSDRFREVVRAALEAAEASDGAFDPTVLPALLRLGYDRPFDALVETAPADPVPAGRWRAVRIGRDTVEVPRGSGLDLGGIAKGLAVDAGICALAAAGIPSALLSGGGDLAVLGLPPGLDAWPVELAALPGHPVLGLVRGAVATSGPSRRRWRQGPWLRHHLVDPRTGLPAETGLAAVVVVADRCGRADVAATAAFVLGPERGAALIAAWGLAGWLVGADGSVRTAGPVPVLGGSAGRDEP